MYKKIKTVKNQNVSPQPDLAKCSVCGWKGKISDCESEQEGNYMDGYITVLLCPKCEDGGCIDDYDMSFLQGFRYWWWGKKKDIKCFFGHHVWEWKNITLRGGKAVGYRCEHCGLWDQKRSKHGSWEEWREWNKEINYDSILVKQQNQKKHWIFSKKR